MTSGMRTVVCDAGPLIHLSELGCLDLLLDFEHVLVSQQSGAIFLTDDAAARIAAQTLGMTVHGSIGVLLRSLRRQQRTKPEVLSLLRQLPALSTLHIAPRLLASIIGEVEQL